jgi:predicted nucleic acid-binding protein
MIAADTSSWIDYSQGAESKSAGQLAAALDQGNLVIPLIVLVEVLSGPKITSEAETLILALPRLDLTSGYWERTAKLRRTLLKKGSKARLGDCLIAQNCMDQDVPLIAGDRDFRHFVKLGLRLL